MNGNSGNRFTFDFAPLEIVAEEQKLCMKRDDYYDELYLLIRTLLVGWWRRWRMDVVAGTGLDTSRRHSVWSGRTSSASSPGRQADRHHSTSRYTPPVGVLESPLWWGQVEQQQKQRWHSGEVEWIVALLFLLIFLYSLIFTLTLVLLVLLLCTIPRVDDERSAIHIRVPSVMCWMVFLQYIKMEWCK